MREDTPVEGGLEPAVTRRYSVSRAAARLNSESCRHCGRRKRWDRLAQREAVRCNVHVTVPIGHMTHVTSPPPHPRTRQQQTSSQPATCRVQYYSDSGVRPVASSCTAVTNCLPSAGVWESAAPYGNSPTSLATVPSHTLARASPGVHVTCNPGSSAASHDVLQYAGVLCASSSPCLVSSCDTATVQHGCPCCSSHLRRLQLRLTCTTSVLQSFSRGGPAAAAWT